MIPINEIFESVQGEGRTIGEPATFIRVAGCNLSCHFCDSKYSWDVKDATEMTEEDLVKKIIKLSPKRIVFTGGEPLLYQKSIIKTIDILLHNKNCDHYIIEVETNGTIAPTDHLSVLVEHFNVSPKLGHINNDAIEAFTKLNTANFKFVVTNGADVKTVIELSEKFDISKDRIMLMPEGASRKKAVESFKKFVPVAIKHGFRLSPRLHILLWDKERGV